MAKTIKIPFIPRTEQHQILRYQTLNQFFTAVCHRRMGKTVLAANWLIKEAFAQIEDYRGYYIAPNQKQAKQIVWAYFKTYLGPLGRLVNFNETELRIDLPNNCKIYLAGSENVESLRGIYIDRAVLDEMASWSNPQYAFFEVLYPAMTDRQGHAMIIGTVKGLDLFHEFYMMGQDDTYPEWGSIVFPVTETSVFTEQEIAKMRRMMRPDAFAREYLCDWFAEAPDTLISPAELYDAVNRDISSHNISSFPEVWGFDVGYTSDPSVLARRKGPDLRQLTELKDKDSVYQARWLKTQIDKYKPQYLYIDAGYGEGVIAQLSDLGYDHVVIPIWFNAKSPKPSCSNMRAYMYNEFKRWLRGGSIPKDDKLMKQASNQFLDEGDADRRIKLQPKKKVKEAIGESPDRSDAVALTFAGGNEEGLSPEEQLASMDPNTMDVATYRELTQQKEYDPLTYMETLCDDNNIDLSELL